MQATSAVHATHSYCQIVFPDDPLSMATMVFGCLPFHVVSAGSHKYIPADKLSQDLGLPIGAGVYGYAKMNDGSYVLMTCGSVGLAVWSGNKDEEPKLIGKIVSRA